MNNASVAKIGIPTTLANDNWADMAGMVASIACAIHCAAMPLALAYLPTFGLSWLADEGFHQWMAVVCFAIAAFAFMPGWRKHGSLVPAIWGTAGVMLLSTAAFGMECSCCPSQEIEKQAIQEIDKSSVAASFETGCTDKTCEFCIKENDSGESAAAPSSKFAWLTPLVTPLGGLLLVVGHVVNHRKSCQCRGSSCCLENSDGEQSDATDIKA